MAYYDYISAADLRAARERDARELIQVIHHNPANPMKNTIAPATTFDKAFDKAVANIVAARRLSTIALEIKSIWSQQGKGVYFGAVPYLNAMATLDTIDDTYGCDDAETIVLYFLANATSFRGPDAVRLKKELKAIAKIK